MALHPLTLQGRVGEKEAGREARCTAATFQEGCQGVLSRAQHWAGDGEAGVTTVNSDRAPTPNPPVLCAQGTLPRPSEGEQSNRAGPIPFSLHGLLQPRMGGQVLTQQLTQFHGETIDFP